MLPGDTGNVGERRDGNLRHDENFVVRTRAAWVARSYAVLIPDTVDGANLRSARSSPAYGRIVDALARYARDRHDAPVFLWAPAKEPSRPSTVPRTHHPA